MTKPLTADEMETLKRVAARRDGEYVALRLVVRLALELNERLTKLEANVR